METHEFRAMNTQILLAAEGRPSRIQEGFERVEERVHALEGCLSRFQETSELSALNHSAGTWFNASPDLFTLMNLAWKAYQQTGGLFNPAVLASLERSGYDRSMDAIRAQGGSLPAAPAGGESARPSAEEAFSGLRLDAAVRAIYLPEDVRVDLGGIAKGWIAEQAAHLLGSYARACLVDAGGDMYAIGLPELESAWAVALEDPFDPDRDLAVLSLPPGAVATSTVTRRRWTQGGQARHHLIDPRSGHPAETEWASVTVVDAHTAQAEVLAKALLIGGSPAVDDLLRNHPTAAYLAVDWGGKLWGSANSHRLLQAQIAGRVGPDLAW
jgi:thiamine biosynthesis lipoprotein